MTEIDSFSRTLMEEAKRFFEKSLEKGDLEGTLAYRKAALMLGFAALEASINAIAEELCLREEFTPLERSVLLERDVQFEKGQITLTHRLRMYRLEERIQFLYRRFSGKPIDGRRQWWQDLKSGVALRNALVHPKRSSSISSKALANTLSALIKTLDVLYGAIYGRGYPGTGRGLDSTMDF